MRDSEDFHLNGFRIVKRGVRLIDILCRVDSGSLNFFSRITVIFVSPPRRGSKRNIDCSSERIVTVAERALSASLVRLELNFSQVVDKRKVTLVCFTISQFSSNVAPRGSVNANKNARATNRKESSRTSSFFFEPWPLHCRN